eukprot:3940862-Rhodomonas_salina.1
MGTESSTAMATHDTTLPARGQNRCLYPTDAGKPTDAHSRSASGVSRAQEGEAREEGQAEALPRLMKKAPTRRGRPRQLAEAWLRPVAAGEESHRGARLQRERRGRMGKALTRRSLPRGRGSEKGVCRRSWQRPC